MSLRLIIEDDEGSTTIVPLGKDAITIGRQQGNTIQLTEKNVSRHHAQLLPDGESWIIEDLGSYNGVKVNGRVTSGRVILQEGDVVQIGDYHLALTEDVDRRSLNYDRGRPAANDGSEPMTASSSTSLPQLTPAALAALSSGQHPAHVAAAMPPSFVDSGQMPMVARRRAPANDEQPRRIGLMLLVLAGIGGVALGGFWWASRTPAPSTAANSTVKPEGKSDAPTKAPDVKPSGPEKPVDTKVPPQIEPVPPKIVPIVPEVPDEQPDIVPDEPEPDTTPVAKPTPPKPTPPKPTPPKPTAEPEVDTEALLADARKQMFKSPATAYELAAKAYAAKKSSNAAFLMASAACRLKDATKARKAIGKLKGQSHDEAVAICSGQGIEIE